MTPDLKTTDLRVLLVGRSPAENRLRSDPRLELVRARSAFDAIGELSLADPAGPEHTLVLVDENTIDAARAPALVAALRRVEPRARIARLASAPAGAAGAGVQPGDGLFDALVTADAAPEALLALGLEADPLPPAHVVQAAPVQGTGSVTGPYFAEPRRSTRPDDPAPRAAASAASVSALSGSQATHPSPLSPSAPDGEATLVMALVSGQDATAQALALLELRGGPAGARFTAGATPPVSVEACAPVVLRGSTIGWLAAPGASAAQLAPWAQWLAPWAALAAQHAELRRAAFTDCLTGAWNRRYLERFLSLAIERARARRHHLTVLLFDIDDFKRYNDRYGHAAGDEILVETVRLLTSVIRPTDRVCRIGGDEFAVVFDEPAGPRDPGSRHPGSIFDIARRFQKQIIEHRFPKLGAEASGTLTISGGMATFPWDAAEPATLLDRADRLLLDSKRRGKNVICLGPGCPAPEQGSILRPVP